MHCKKRTHTKGRTVKSVGNRRSEKGTCSVCGSKKTRFIGKAGGVAEVKSRNLEKKRSDARKTIEILEANANDDDEVHLPQRIVKGKKA